MIRDYPLTGVGTGAYIIELPNYLKIMNAPSRHTDSAENYFLQIGAELGLIGLILIVWIFIEVFKQVRKNWRYNLKRKNNEVFLLTGIISGIIAIFVNLFVHSYVGSFEVMYFFWILVALVFIYSRTDNEIKERSKFNIQMKSLMIILPLVFGLIHLWNSSHSLSINAETQKYGWVQNFGFYKQERDNRGFMFQWTKKSAGLMINNIGPIVVIPLMASHPDINRNPVKVKIFIADSYFNKMKVLNTITLNNKYWVNIEFPIPNMNNTINNDKIYLVFETNRTWQPLKYLGIPDPRSLGVALGQIWFRYPSEISRGEIKLIETVVSKKWEKAGPILLSNRESTIKFNVKEKNAAIRLWMKGKKALGVGPYVIIKLDDKIIGKTMLDSEDWKPLIFTHKICKGNHLLSVEFINDFYNPKLKLDRNVYLGNLDVIYLVRH
jgi:hypothetical protein